MTNTNEDLGKRVEQMIAEHVAATRKVAQEAIERAFASSAVTAPIVARPVRVRESGKRRGTAFGAPWGSEALVQACVVLPVDEMAADVAATMWSGSARKARQSLGDLLIAAVAVARRLPLVTRNQRDFEEFAKASGARLSLLDWTKPANRRG